jgi:hypothetical protein
METMSRQQTLEGAVEFRQRRVDVVKERLKELNNVVCESASQSLELKWLKLDLRWYELQLIEAQTALAVESTDLRRPL